MIERRSALRAAVAFALVWTGSFALYTEGFGGDATLPLLSLLFLGLLLPLLAWPLTQNIPLSAPTALQPRDTAFAILYLTIFAAILLGFGFSWVRTEISLRQTQEVILLAAKLLFMVGVPLLLMRAAERHALISRSAARRPILLAAAVLGLAAATISAMATSAVQQVAALDLGMAGLGFAIIGTAIWVTLGAALTEEILFRAFLQPRLAETFRSEAWAVATGAILFALVHVPGLYLRTDQADLMQNGSPSLLACVGYSIAVLSPPGILFGILWARTRNLFLIVVVHALIDLPPNVAEFVGLAG